MEIIRSFLSEAHELLTRINDEVLALEADAEDRELLNSVYRTAHTLKGSANLYGFSGIALITHLLESLLDEVRDGLQHMNGAMVDLLLESFDQVRTLVQEIESGKEDPQPESDLLHRLREVVRSDAAPADTSRWTNADESRLLDVTLWMKEVSAYARGIPSDREMPFHHFLSEGLPHAEPVGEMEQSDVLRELVSVGGELRKKRKNIRPTKDKLAQLVELLVKSAHDRESDTNRPDGGIRLLLAVAVMVHSALEREEQEEALPSWWNDVWEQWMALADGLAEGKAAAQGLDMVLDVWELCGTKGLPEGMRRGLLPPPVFEENPAETGDWETGEYVSPSRETAAAAEAVELTRESEPSCTLECGIDEGMIQKLLVEQIRYLAPRGKPLIERWGLASRILEQCSILLSDNTMMELARRSAPDMGRLKVCAMQYMDHREEQIIITDSTAAEAPGAVISPARGGSKDGKGQDTPPDAAEQDRIIRIEQGKIDRLMELVGELAVAKNALPYLISKLNDYEIAGALKEKVAMVDRIVKELQDAILDVRMLPLSSVFSKFSRFVRDIAKQSNKQVALELMGEETTLDKTLVEALFEPLLHLVRNAIDHGIESPEERVKVGKPPEGYLSLKAWREGNKVWIEVQDDGRGIDTELIRKKLIQEGIHTKEEAERLGYDELLSQIYQAGFTTADGVTSISGRGVGMDAVLSNVRQMRGLLHLNSVLGQGTCIRMELPMTLTVIQVLQVVVDGRSYGIPLDQIEQTLRPKQQNLHKLQGRWMIKLDNRVLPIVFLRERFNKREGGELNPSEAPYTVILKSGIGLVVDSLSGQQEVVVKPLDPALKGLDYLAGAAILGDGSVLLILNGSGLSR